MSESEPNSPRRPVWPRREVPVGLRERYLAEGWRTDDTLELGEVTAELERIGVARQRWPEVDLRRQLRAGDL